MARYLVEALRDAEARFIPGEGHLSLSRKYAADILASALQSE